MKCIHCKGQMQHGTAPFHVDRHGFHLTLDAVPGWICSQCGEVYFEESQVDAIQRMLQMMDEQAIKLVGTS